MQRPIAQNVLRNFKKQRRRFCSSKSSSKIKLITLLSLVVKIKSIFIHKTTVPFIPLQEWTAFLFLSLSCWSCEAIWQQQYSGAKLSTLQTFNKASSNWEVAPKASYTIICSHPYNWCHQHTLLKKLSTLSSFNRTVLLTAVFVKQ